MEKFFRITRSTIATARMFFFLGYYKILNRNKERILLYTDSRGYQIADLDCRKTPFKSYLYSFIKKYNCDVHICEEKHTTIFDFLYLYENNIRRKKYDYVISHIGVVDFSPRPYNDIESILNLKKNKTIKIFGKEFFNKLIDLKIYEEEYFGVKTSAILAEENLELIGNKFSKIPNHIWISCNPVDLKWRGNYPKDRPININMVNDKRKQLMNLLGNNVNIIDFTNFSLKEVRKYTCDNIHMSDEGMDLIKEKIKQCLEKK